jgi:hypothetical protein
MAHLETAPIPRFRREILFEILITLFQEFDHGQIVEQVVPASWKLKPGDRFLYEAGQNISGIAEVLQCKSIPGTGEILGSFLKIT